MAAQTFAAYDLKFSSRNRTEQIAEHNLSRLAAQQRNRRGPTPEVFFSKKLDNSRLVKAPDKARVREMRVFTAALAAMFVIAMFYGWQHFSAIECGYKVSAEKQQVDALQEQNRELRLAEAQLCDPHRIDRMARGLGLAAPKPGQVVSGDNASDGSVMADASHAAPHF